MSLPSTPRILVLGAGGIGGIVAAHLNELGADVTAVTSNQQVVAAVRARGFRLAGDGPVHAVPGRIAEAIPAGDRYDLVLLATQPPAVEAAARGALPHLAPGGQLVCFQNGLCEQRLAAIAGAERVIGAIVSWGASMPEPGLYDRTAAGGFVLGRLDGGLDEAVQQVGQLLQVVGPVQTTRNLLGARWSKLALNCAVSSLGTLAGEALGPVVRVRRYRRLALEIFSEVVQVARAEAVQLEPVAGTIDLHWICLTPEERRSRLGSPGLTAKHAALLAVGLRYRRLRSSMLAALERGRPPAIDFLNGEVVQRGRAHGIPVPVNQQVVEDVWAIFRGRKRPGRDLLDALIERTLHERMEHA
jgi:2-dehydropantoate 2-reductase